MFRYFAFTWDAPDSSAALEVRRRLARLREHDPGWRIAFDCPGLLVLWSDPRPDADVVYPLPDGQGAIVGKLFRRDDDAEKSTAVNSLTDEDGAAIVRSGGSHLISHFWGRYAAFIASARDDAFRVLRDPAGTMPCFEVEYRGIHSFFSWTEDALTAGLPLSSVNWEYLAAQLALYALESRETAVAGMSQLLGGECLEIRGSRVRRSLLWNPHQYALDRIDDPNAAAAALRRTVRTCVRSWSSCYDHTLVRLSGGLDSSIIMACLARSSWDRQVTCVNYYLPNCDSDERRYARLTAAASARKLIEQEQDTAIRLEDLLAMARSPKPTFYVECLDLYRFEALAARREKASVVFTGTGGDQLFYRTQVVLPAVDYARLHGLRPSLARRALDAAQLSGETIWTALGAAVRDGILSRAADPRAGQAERETLVPRELMELARRDRRFLHPAMQQGGPTPPGKLRQLRQFLYSLEYYDPLGAPDGPQYVHPLLSQPVIELCLRIPTYVLIDGGWDRALARRAFAQDLPDVITRRKSKGGSGDQYKVVLLNNLDFARSMLLDGVLVRQGLLDSRKLEEVLSGRPSRIVSSASQLHTYLGAEVWARRWTEMRERAAA